MSTPLRILVFLKAIGVSVRTDGDSLNYRAAFGIVGSELREIVRQHLPAIHSLVKRIESRITQLQNQGSGIAEATTAAWEPIMDEYEKELSGGKNHVTGCS